MRRSSRIASLLLTFCLGLASCERGADPGNEGDKAADEARPASEAVRVPLTGAKLKGDDKALVTVVEFSDYQCPFCKKGHQTVEALLGDYQGRVRLAVLENPLPFHDHARAAASWAFAAGEQGKYWQARELLFDNQKGLDEDGLAAMARSLGLDPERLERDRHSIAAERAVQGGLDLGAAIGVTGTPTFFVNGKPIVGAQPAGVFREAIDAALIAAKAMVARGIRPESVYAEIMKTASPAMPKVGHSGDTPGGKPGGKPGRGKAAGAKAAGDGDEGHCRGNCAEPAEGDDDNANADLPPAAIDLAKAPIRGAADAVVTVVVFTDFECPFCRKGEDTLRALEAEYKGKLRVVHKSYPLPMHEHAGLAAAAAFAAGLQSKFWEYHDALFQHQDALDRQALLGYATALGLDLGRFEKDLDDPATAAAVAADQAQASKLGVQGTPSFFINGRRLNGAQPAAAFRALIDRALAER